jgi:hypothetical protein
MAKLDWNVDPERSDGRPGSPQLGRCGTMSVRAWSQALYSLIMMGWTTSWLPGLSRRLSMRPRRTAVSLQPQVKD